MSADILEDVWWEAQQFDEVDDWWPDDKIVWHQGVFLPYPILGEFVFTGGVRLPRPALGQISANLGRLPAPLLGQIALPGFTFRPARLGNNAIADGGTNAPGQLPAPILSQLALTSGVRTGMRLLQTPTTIELPPPVVGEIAFKARMPVALAELSWSNLHYTYVLGQPPATHGAIGTDVLTGLSPPVALADFEGVTNGILSRFGGIAGVAGDFEGALAGRVSFSISSITGDGGAFDGILSGQKGSAGAVSGNVADLEGLLSAFVYINGLVGGAVATFGALVSGLSQASGNWLANAMNLRTSAVTEFGSAFKFNSLIEHQGRYYGASASGLYELSGADDAGAAIAASATTCITDHAVDGALDPEYLKRPTDAYVVGKSTARPLTLTVIVDEGQSSYDYSLPTDTATAVGQIKVDLGRGVRAHKFQYRISNTAGADFEATSLEVLLSQLERRKR